MPAGSKETRHQSPVLTGRILIVDDDPEFAESLEILLTMEGYEVEFALSAAAAHEALESFDAEVAMIDIRLAGSSGINLIGTFAREHPRILCVMMTAYASAETAIEALHQGAYDYLRKPFHRNDLLATLDRCFERLALVREKSTVDAALRARNQELEQVNKRLQLVVHSMRGLTSHSTLHELCPRVLEEVARNMAADGGSVYLREGDALILKHALDPGHATPRLALPLEPSSVFGRALGAGQPILATTFGGDRDLTPSGWAGYDGSSVLAFPLLGDDGEVIGVLSLHAKQDPPFSEQDRDIGLILVSFACETIRAVQALEDLARSEKRYRSLIESSPICIHEIDLSGKLISMNRSGLVMLGLESEAEIVGQEYLQFIAPHDRERVGGLLDGARQGVDSQFEFSCEWGGGQRICASSFAPLVGPDGLTQRIIGITQDITDRKRAEEQLHQAQKMEAVGQLTGGVAHDFNNLLAIILGNAELVGELLGPEHDLNRYMAAVNRAATRGAELTSRLLAFSRRQAHSPKAVDLSATLTGMADMLARTLGEPIEIVTINEPDLWRTFTDPGQAENAILNLAINARDAMPDGGRLVIETANRVIDGHEETELEPGEYVMLAVSDTGTGMSPEVLLHVFEPFFTTKDVGQGSGLGLSMIYGFVKQSGGDITITSVEGEGTTIRVTLPRAKEAAEGADRMEDGESPAAHGETVLVLEDDSEVRALVAATLTNLGYKVLEARDGKDALRKLDGTAEVDLLLSDIVLPGGMNGAEVAERARDRVPGLKVLFMSGYAPAMAGQKYAQRLGHGLLHKPFPKRTLAQQVRRLLDDTADGGRQAGGP